MKICSTISVSACSFIILLTMGCATSFKKFEQFVPDGHTVQVNFDNNHSGHQLKIFYVTCGMMFIQHGDDAVMFDPFFSYQRFLDFYTGIRTSKRYYKMFQEQFDTTMNRNAVKAAFISHTHYDHVMDLPVLLKDRFFPDLTTIYGNSFAPEMLHHHQGNGVAIKAIQDEQLFNPLTKNQDTAYQWIAVSDAISVLPIASEHAPQKMGILVMNSNLDAGYFQKDKFKDPYVKSNAYKWDVGCNYSFLVRLKNADGTYFKILVQTSASNPPFGLPPKGERADMAILCLASLQEVRNYPKYFMEGTGASKLVFVHWEDFFRRPENSNDVKFIRATNKRLTLRRIKEVQQLPTHPDVIMPKPGTVLNVRY